MSVKVSPAGTVTPGAAAGLAIGAPVEARRYNAAAPALQPTGSAEATPQVGSRRSRPNLRGPRSRSLRSACREPVSLPRRSHRLRPLPHRARAPRAGLRSGDRTARPTPCYDDSTASQRKAAPSADPSFGERRVTFSFDRADPEIARNPYPAYARLRARRPGALEPRPRRLDAHPFRRRYGGAGATAASLGRPRHALRRTHGRDFAPGRRSHGARARALDGVQRPAAPPCLAPPRRGSLHADGGGQLAPAPWRRSSTSCSTPSPDAAADAT